MGFPAELLVGAASTASKGFHSAMSNIGHGINGAMNRKNAREMQKKQQEYTQANMKLAQELELDKASKMPSAQVQGMTDAGINPMIAMGSAGQGSPGTAQMAQQPRSLADELPSGGTAQRPSKIQLAQDRLIAKAISNDLKKI